MFFNTAEAVGSVTLWISTASVERLLGRGWWSIILREAASLAFLFVVLTILMRREISRPLSLVADRLKEIAQGDGDLTQRIVITAPTTRSATLRVRSISLSISSLSLSPGSACRRIRSR